MPGVRDRIRRMAGYAPGEQPRDGEFVKLNTNESPYPPSPRVLDALRDALSGDLAGDRLRKYPDPTGTAFRKAAGEVLGVDPDGVVVGNGSDDILTILTRTFVNEGGLIVSPTPSYILYRSLAEIQGARFETVPFAPDWTLPPDWPHPAADLTFLANPNSPSGTVVDAAGIDRLLGQLDGPLVLDEAYVDYAPAHGLAFAARADRPVVVSRTLSKSYALAGLRFGFAVTRPDVAREMLKVKDSYNCDALALAAATAAILDQEYLSETRRKVLATRGRLAAGMAALGYAVTPSEANFVWCRHPDGRHREVYEGLRERRILVRYMPYAGYGDGLRVSVGTDAEVERLLGELRKM